MSIEDYLEAGALEPSSHFVAQFNNRKRIEPPWCRAFRVGDFEQAAQLVIAYEENLRAQVEGGEESLAEYDELWPEPRQLQLRGRTLPAWTGEHVGNVIVYHLQGYGDAFWLGRYLPALLELVDSVSVIAPAIAYDLFKANMPNGVEVFDRFNGADALKRADAWAGSTLLPYQSKQGYGAAAWIKSQHQCAPHDKPRIGVIWSGGASNIFNNLRSISIARLMPLFKIPGLEWHSLQVGEKAGECPEGVINHVDDIGNWLDTAELVASLDLVISVDTGCANLVGAMGRPLWVLVEQYSDFRWGNAGERTPWFPSARVFRQSNAVSRVLRWQPVIHRVAAALVEWKAKRETNAIREGIRQSASKGAANGSSENASGQHPY